MLDAGLLRSAKAYDMQPLVYFSVGSGFLRSSDHARFVAEAALRAIVTEPEVAQYYLDILRSKAKTIPSATTLRRHRLTLHMGVLRLHAEDHRGVLP